MEALAHWLYLVSSALLVPVLVSLLALLGWMLILLGGFVRELLTRKMVRRHLEAIVSARGATATADAWRSLAQVSSGLPGRFCQRTADRRSDDAYLAKALLDVEHDVAASVATLSFCTRVAPMLGLMGTLIPLGPALMGLASGSVAEMAKNLVVAFTATVVGLLVSCVTYGMGLARRTWYARDMSDLEFLAQRLAVREAAP